MARDTQERDHVRLIMVKAMRALTRYAAAGIEETGLGLSDFGVLEVLLHHLRNRLVFSASSVAQPKTPSNASSTDVWLNSRITPSAAAD
jgi:hypothetical protein